jgi:hypothetical protein
MHFPKLDVAGSIPVSRSNQAKQSKQLTENIKSEAEAVFPAGCSLGADFHARINVFYAGITEVPQM